MQDATPTECTTSCVEAVEPPEDLLCPVLRSLFSDPVVNAAGNTYERAALEHFWGRAEEIGLPYVDPLTNVSVSHGELITNWDMRRRVQAFVAENPSCIPETWLDGKMPPPAAPMPETSRTTASETEKGSNEDGLHQVIVALMVLVAALIGALCLTAQGIAVEQIPSLLSSTAGNFWRWVARHTYDVDSLWVGAFFLFLAEVVFFTAWLLDSLSYHGSARCTLCGALLLTGKAVTSFAATSTISSNGDHLLLNVVLMSSLVCGMMLAISCFELPLLRTGGRDAVRRLTMKLVFFDGVLLLGLLATLASIDTCAPGLTAHPLVVTGAGLLAAGFALMTIGFQATPGLRRFICVALLGTGGSLTAYAYMLHRAVSLKQL